MIDQLKIALSAMDHLKSAEDDLEQTEARAEVQKAILEAHARTDRMRSERDLAVDAHKKVSQELVDRQNWEKISKIYSLTETAMGTFVYRSIDQEPAHCICPSCFDNQQRSILQKTGDVKRKAQTETWFYQEQCPICEFVVAIDMAPSQGSPIVRTNRERRRF